MQNIEVLVNGKYKLMMPEYRAARPEWLIENGGWEVERIEEMLDFIKPEHLVFDIGTEAGDISALLMKESGCSMRLFEPNERVLPSIKTMFLANNLELPPLFLGFVANEDFQVLPHGELHLNWDHVGEGANINPEHGFKALNENYPDVQKIKLDAYCAREGVFPDVITMDCEGSEFEIIRGAEYVIREHKPTIFMSVHPEFMYESYRNEGKWKEMYGERQHVVHMLRFIDELGYTHRMIEYDYHELHMRFDPK